MRSGSQVWAVVPSSDGGTSTGWPWQRLGPGQRVPDEHAVVRALRSGRSGEERPLVRLRHVLRGRRPASSVDHPGERGRPESGVVPGGLERPVEVTPDVVDVLDGPAGEQQVSAHAVRGRPERVERLG